MALSPTCDLFVIAGEPSGDAYAAAVVGELRRRQPELVVAAMGGKALVDAGAEVEQDIDGLAVMGLMPVLARLPSFIRLGLRMAELIRARKPRAVLTVDYPGFNLRLLRRTADLRRQGTRFVHLVAPQVWAWKPRRAKPVARSVDRLLCFFPFEPPLFARFGCRADFVGHPLVDLIPPGARAAGDGSGLGVATGEQVLLLAPGSREREVAALLGLYSDAAEWAASRLEARSGRRVRVVVSRVPDLPLELYRARTAFPLVEGRYRDLCARAHVAVVASGTATLEAALIGVPHVIAYRTDRLSAAIARQVIVAPHVGLPNLVSGRRVCPEVLQDELTVPRLVAHIERLWDGPGREACRSGLAGIRGRLGAGGAIARIADAVEDEMDRGKRARTREFTSESAGPAAGDEATAGRL